MVSIKTLIQITFLVICCVTVTKCNNITVLSAKVARLKEQLATLKKSQAHIMRQSNILDNLNTTYVRRIKEIHEKNKDFIRKSINQWFSRWFTRSFIPWRRRQIFRHVLLLIRSKQLQSKKELIKIIVTARSDMIKRLREARKLRNRAASHAETRKRKQAVDRFIKKFNSTRSVSALTTISNELYMTSRQARLHEFNGIERSRSDGYSGVKQIQCRTVGARNYFSADHKDWSVVDSFDLPSTKDRVGYGTFSGVLNGVEFRREAEEYKLQQPSYDGVYDKTVDLHYPNVQMGIADMRKLLWDFHTSKNKDSRFIPVVNYLEGVWEKAELHDSTYQAMKYQMDTGANPTGIPFIPQNIVSFSATNKSEIGSFITRIVSHPINASKLLPHMFRMNSDIVSQLRYYNTHLNLMNSPAADFTLEHNNVHGSETDGFQWYSLLDAIMEEIIGKQNTDVLLPSKGLDGENLKSANPLDKSNVFNSAKYHRSYVLQEKDAMGISRAQRSFSDRLYVSFNSHPNVVGFKIKTKMGTTREDKVSYALPLEVIYITPLTNWNPYNVSYKKNCTNVNGDGSKENPFDAACSDRYFFTPLALFNETASCDSSFGENAYYFKSSTGIPVCLVGSGFRTLLPLISGQKERIRQRYPIVRAYKDGHPASKKLNAVEDSVAFKVNNLISKVSFKTGFSSREGVPCHSHHIRLTVSQYRELKKSKKIKNVKTVEDGNGHQHIMTLTMEADGSIKVTACGQPSHKEGTVCWDQHAPDVTLIAEPLKPGSGYNYGYGYGNGRGY